MQEQYKRMEIDDDLLPMLKKHRRKAVQELERLMEMEPSSGVEQAMMPVILMLMGSEFLEEHMGGGKPAQHGGTIGGIVSPHAGGGAGGFGGAAGGMGARAREKHEPDDDEEPHTKGYPMSR